MNSFKQDAILQPVADLRLYVDSSNPVEVGNEGRVICCGIYGFKVIDAFSRCY